ncbi:hypothetical protein BJY01DRAFT_221180 [Aspergillus pseudoustus]|uniref:Uncharacterized protein n=1 Tax=Aspergillus pseudoustus TaxID=1810923 RepID=A0ABR4JBC0_9EURO
MSHPVHNNQTTNNKAKPRRNRRRSNSPRSSQSPRGRRNQSPNTNANKNQHQHPKQQERQGQRPFTVPENHQYSIVDGTMPSSCAHCGHDSNYHRVICPNPRCGLPKLPTKVTVTNMGSFTEIPIKHDLTTFGEVLNAYNKKRAAGAASAGAAAGAGAHKLPSFAEPVKKTATPVVYEKLWVAVGGPHNKFRPISLSLPITRAWMRDSSLYLYVDWEGKKEAQEAFVELQRKQAASQMCRLMGIKWDPKWESADAIPENMQGKKGAQEGEKEGAGNEDDAEEGWSKVPSGKDKGKQRKGGQN